MVSIHISWQPSDSDLRDRFTFISSSHGYWREAIQSPKGGGSLMVGELTRCHSVKKKKVSIFMKGCESHVKDGKLICNYPGFKIHSC